MTIASTRTIERATELVNTGRVRATNRPTVYYVAASDGSEHRVHVEYEHITDTGPVIDVDCACTWGRYRASAGQLCTHATAVLMAIKQERTLLW